MTAGKTFLTLIVGFIVLLLFIASHPESPTPKEQPSPAPSASRQSAERATGVCGKPGVSDCATARQLEAELLQESLWKQGHEITVSIRGRQLIFQYALAGNAFAYNFGNEFVGPVATTLKEMGFREVVLIDGEDDTWKWNVTK